MRPDPPTSFLLDARTGWREGSSVDVDADRRDALRLAPDPAGPLASDADLDRPGLPPTDPTAPPLYLTSGTWISQALDSRIYRCQWHRVELELDDLPPGSRVVLNTYSSDDEESAERIAALPEDLWATRFSTAGPMQPPEVPPEGLPASEEFLVLDGAGQYLWLRLELEGDGDVTPRVRSLRVHYPRRSYLDDLPAVYGAEGESPFLERYLSIAQTEWDELDRRVATFARHLDPRAVPEGPFLEYLAKWLALPLEGDWTGEQQRRLLAAAPGFYPRRGRRRGLADVLAVYLWNAGGPPPDAQLGFPRLVEGFRERRLVLHLRHAGHLASLGRLWGRGLVGRLQLGVYSETGEARLVSTGDPERDVFYEHAHRFRVFVPSAWVPSGDEERRLRRAVELEKPAHTRYELCLVEPRYRVGVQSTLGLDAVVGVVPRMRLHCCHHEADPVPSRSPRQRLGVDTVLGGGRRRPAPPPPTHGRLGHDTVLRHVEEGR